MKTIALLLCCMLAATLSQARVIHVPQDYPTIQQGINAAWPGDTVLVSDGIYFERINFMGKKPLTVASEYILSRDENHVAHTIIDGSNIASTINASVVYFIYGEDTTSVLTGFTIRNGRGTMYYNDDIRFRSGGAIMISRSGARIVHNRITENHLYYNPLNNDIDVYCGAGIATEAIDSDDWVVIEDNDIDQNECISGISKAYGAGIAVHCNARIKGNKITGNLCRGHNESLASGAGIFCETTDDWTYKITVEVLDNIISGNLVQSEDNYAAYAGCLLRHVTATFAGNLVEDNTVISGTSTGGAGGLGFFIPIGEIHISGNTFRNNSSNVVGGGLVLETNSAHLNQNSVYIDNNYFISNHAQDGGALSIRNVAACLQNNVFTSNSADHRAGAILAWRDLTLETHYMIRIINNSFYDNSSNYGGAFYSVNSKPLVFNSIFHNNNANYLGPALYVPYALDTVEIGYSNIDLTRVFGRYIDGGHNIAGNPLFEDTELLTLTTGSPCIDAGTKVYTCNCGYLHSCPCVDIDGIPRPEGGGVDIGAHELLMTAAPGHFETIEFDLCRVYPNPVIEKATFEYSLESPGTINLSVYDITGRRVTELVNGFRDRGEHLVIWDTEGLPAGSYIYRYSTNDNQQSMTGTLVIVR